MKSLSKYLKIKFLLVIYFLAHSYSFADNHNISELIESLQKDIKTLEKAVYSNTNQLNTETNNSSNLNLNNNSEDVLTRHLLKLSEIEQFQKLIDLKMV